MMRLHIIGVCMSFVAKKLHVLKVAAFNVYGLNYRKRILITRKTAQTPLPRKRRARRRPS